MDREDIRGRLRSRSEPKAGIRVSSAVHHQRIDPVEPDSSKLKSSPRLVSLELRLPNLKLARLTSLRLPKLPYKLIIIILAITIVSAIGVFFAPKILNKKRVGSDAGTTVLNPGFKAVVPQGKPDIAKVQGATSTYDPIKHVLSFTDSFMGADFTISQQPLPESFKTDPDALNNIATSLGTKQTIDTKHGVVYLSTDAKTKGQIAVLVKDNLLVFIRSSKESDKTIWQGYINNLK